MEFLTDEKLVIVGAAGMIGSNMAQTAAMLGLTPNICLYDVYEPGLAGVTERSVQGCKVHHLVGRCSSKGRYDTRRPAQRQRRRSRTVG